MTQSVIECGPIYGVSLIQSVPISTTGMNQACPGSRELRAASKAGFQRLVAAYEVLLSHYKMNEESTKKEEGCK